MLFDAQKKQLLQLLVDIYNRLEPWIVGIIFLFFGIWFTNIYQSASTAGKKEEHNTFLYWMLHIDKFQLLLASIILLIVIFFGYKLKKLPTSKEIELQSELKEAKKH